MENLKVVILAGGTGTRLVEETETRPKPMVEIGGMPLLWHIMKIYGAQGFKDFVICLGYKGYMIKEYFNNYILHSSDVTIDLAEGVTTVHNRRTEPWKITLVDTGRHSMTGGRLKRVQPYLSNGTRFLMTYGDGVADIDLKKLLKFHESKGARATVTAVQPPGRFGALDIKAGMVKTFSEKPPGDGGRINGGFFVFDQSIFETIQDDSVSLEKGPLSGLAEKGELAAYQHDGFWQAVDTLRDKQQLENLWQKGDAPWKVW